MEQALTILVAPLISLIPLAPLFGAFACAAIIPAAKERQGITGWVATMFSFISFFVALKVFGPLASGAVGRVEFSLWSWIAVGKLDLNFAFMMDRLSGVMCLIVTGVGSLIHLYSIGYMEEDDSRARFFTYLNLFLAAMLILVLGNSLPVTFIGWEGVGLCSYLLIGFWYKDMSNAVAGQKAFVINRIGDAGLLLGMFFLFFTTGSLDYVGISTAITSQPAWVYETAALLLLIGAIGKSAQLPLHIWLPDAMAGPTPVSALIHAATMVTAGIYLIARMGFLYEGAPQVSAVVAIIGALTALMAATIALVQVDIKKVLAYSTVSQLGFMFLALGVGAYSTAIFHVVTHAFFKACLFMGAGSVIIGCHHEQDMRRFGGLRTKMPVTFVCYLVATLAIAGFPMTSGFYSKDAILYSVYSADSLTLGGYALSKPLFVVAVFTAFLTAFYMVRSLIMTFFGKYRGDESHPPHETSWTMLLPLVVLALLSGVYGYLRHHNFMEFLSSWGRADLLQLADGDAGEEYVELLSSSVAIGGMLISAFIYLFAKSVPATFARALAPLYQLFSNLWFVDPFFNFIADKFFRPISRMLSSLIDRVFISGTVNGVGETTMILGDSLRVLHRGRLNLYLSYMLIGSVFLTLFWLVL